MKYRKLGKNGPTVSAIGLGAGSATTNFGERDDEVQIATVHRAMDLGVTLFDTADVYGPFTNEELLGRALDGRREDVVLATKVGLVVGPSGGYPLLHDARPERILQEIDGSLRRLHTDVIDLYYLHRVDEQVPLEDTWGAMSTLVQAGKVRSLGLSEVSVDEIERAHATHPVSAVQSELSLWTRDALPEVVPWCAANGAAFVPFAPLGRGFLTGAITAGSFDDADFRAQNPRFTPEAIAANLAIVDRLRLVAERHGGTPAQVALAWVLGQGEHVIPIPGTKRVKYLEENVGAAAVHLTPGDLADLESLPNALGSRY